jgi:hypothetical protein
MAMRDRAANHWVIASLITSLAAGAFAALVATQGGPADPRVKA